MNTVGNNWYAMLKKSQNSSREELLEELRVYFEDARGAPVSIEEIRRTTERVTDEQLSEWVSGIRQSAAKTESDKDALRERLRQDRALANIVLPPSDWGTPDDRYHIAKEACELLESASARNKVPLPELVSIMNKQGFTIRDDIKTYSKDNSDYDPRYHGYAPGDRYVAFKYRINDAIGIATADRRAANEQAKRDKQDAAWAAQGLKRCPRCGGAGGWEGWPGWECFECGGRGSVEDQSLYED